MPAPRAAAFSVAFRALLAAALNGALHAAALHAAFSVAFRALLAAALNVALLAFPRRIRPLHVPPLGWSVGMGPRPGLPGRHIVVLRAVGEVAVGVVRARVLEG
eukprot:738647-Heterocapsa_arctica.AAC.1